MSVTRLIRRFNTRFPRDGATLRLRQPCGEDRCQISRVRVSDGHQRNPKARCEFHLMVSFHHVSRIVRKAQRLDVGSVCELHITGIRRDTRQLPCKCRAESLEPTHTGSRTARATCSPSLSSAEHRALRRLGRGAVVPGFVSAVAAQQVPRQPPQLVRREPPLRHQLGGRPLHLLVRHRLRESGRVMIRGHSASVRRFCGVRGLLDIDECGRASPNGTTARRHQPPWAAATSKCETVVSRSTRYSSSSG